MSKEKDTFKEKIDNLDIANSEILFKLIKLEARVKILESKLRIQSLEK